MIALQQALKGQIPITPGMDCNQDGVVDNKDKSCIAQQIGNYKNQGKGSGSGTGNGTSASGSTIATASSLYLYFVYDESGHLLGEYDQNGNLIEEHIWLNNRPIGVITPSGLYYVQTDQLGTPRYITNSSKQLVWEWQSDPLGTTAPNQNPSGLGTFVYNLRFPGQYYDPETGHSYNYFRYYDPTIGRFISSDPIGLRGGINTYAYVGNNPVAYSDRSGLKPGDDFPSAEAAAIDALNYISSKSDRCAREYGGWVYKEWSLFGPPKYTYDEPTALGQTGGTLPDMPILHETDAMFHNHPLLQGYDYNHFSPQDEDTADADNLPSYLLTPTGPILLYMPVPNSPEGGSVTTVGQANNCSCTR